MDPQVAVSDLGDAFVSSLIAATVMVWLWRRIGVVIALVFALAVSAVGASAFGLKLIARDHGRPLDLAGPFDLSQGAPSGHAALAATVFGCAIVLFLKLDRRPLGAFGAILSAGALMSVAVTRVTLHTHTIADVFAALALAAAGILLFERALTVQTVGRSAPTGGLLLAMIAMAILALASGVRLSSAAVL